MKLLIVEPSQLRCRISNILRLGGLEDVQALSSSQEALRMLERESVDLVLIGPYLTAPSGPEFLRQLRLLDKHQHTATLIFLEAPTDEQVLEVAEQNVNGIIVVPFEDAYLLARVRETLRKLRHTKAYHKRLHIVHTG